jgi:tetratricopeptide (TPR) repeat protein
MSHTNVGVVHLNQSDFVSEHYNQALKINEEILPPQHTFISMILENIGNIYYDKGQFDQWLEYYEKVTLIYRQLLPSTHPDVLQIAMIIRRIELKLKLTYSYESSLQISSKTDGMNTHHRFSLDHLAKH